MTPTVNFFYDGIGSQGASFFAKGKLTKVDNTISATEYKKFDNFGRIMISSQITDGQTYDSSYIYNLSGTLIQEIYPSGRVVKNEFEPDGDLAKVISKKAGTSVYTPFASNFSYTADGKIGQLKLGNNLWEAASFNNRLQVTELRLGRSTACDEPHCLWKLGYEYGELNPDGTVNTAQNTGNIAKQTVSFSGLAQPFVQTYKYDSLYRITEAKETKNGNQTWMQTFDYDRYGNRTSFSQNVNGQVLDTTPAIDTNTNRFTSTSFHFDKNGNVTQDIGPNNQPRTIIFNGDNKQTEVKDANGVSIGKYYYDGEGKRVKKVTDLETTVFVYSSGKLVAEYSTAPLPASPTINYTATDMLGSPRVITNALGEVISRRDFMPFGEELFADGQNRMTANNYSQTGQDSVRKRFTGYEKDLETGLDFAEARMYDNRYGRFTAVDPLLSSGKSADPQTFNRFAYVTNNPLMFTDPDGLQVATAAGDVYINKARTQVRIFLDGNVRRGFDRLTENISTTTRVGKVVHRMEVTPNGWTIGDRVDGKKFAASTSPKPSEARDDRVQRLAGGATATYDAAIAGIARGAGNFVLHTAQAALNSNLQAFPVNLSIPYANAAQASYGNAVETGLAAGSIFAGSVFSPSSSLSVVPESVPFRFPPIKAGSAEGATGNRYILVDVRRQAAAENPFNYCVYCRQQSADIQFEHALPLSRGGNNTIENIPRACPFCNQSKGARDFPVNPAPGYEGPFPPPWWNQ